VAWGESVTAEAEQIEGLGEHAVHFYADDRQLAVTVGDYVTRGARAGAVSVVIATESHRRAFEAELAGAGFDVERAQRNAAYISLDAAAMLARFVRGGRLDPDAFRAVIGGVIRRAGRAGRPVRAYGEMVELLWDAGDVLGAIGLEELWNDLRAELRFSLLCAYQSDIVAGDWHTHVCRLHTRVLDETAAGFEPDVGAPAAARRFVARALAEGGHHETRVSGDAVLVVSELATNAVIHARTPFSVSVRFGPAAIRIAVTDRSGSEPVIQDVPPTALSGRGLRLVDAIAGDWGVEPTPDGKVVWAELPTR
jgi:anti-sigma regulatory factor (Ser/Thr protein kinase)